MLSQLAVSLACLAVVLANPPPAIRCPPSKAVGHFMGEVVTSDGKHTTSNSIRGYFVSSHKHQVEFTETTIMTGKKSSVTVRSWKLWAKGVELELDVATNQCKIKRNLSGQMFRGCLDTAEAVSKKSFLVGSNNAEMVKLSHPDFSSAYMTVLSDGLVPVSLVGSGQYEGKTVYTALQYGNVKEGISDYSKLSPPACCKALLGHPHAHHGKKIRG